MWNKVALPLFAVSLAAQTNTVPTGQWVLNLGPRTLLIVRLAPPASPDGAVSGSVTMPGFSTADGRSFSHVQGPPLTSQIAASSWKGNVLSLTVRNPRDASDENRFSFTLKDATHARLQFDFGGFPLPPVDLVLADGEATVATDWDAAKTYSPDDGFASNAEMERIFAEDQKGRTNLDAKADAERREATRKLINEGALHTGEDYTLAAFVFQHGSTPDDFLMAHTLSLIALAKGSRDALWISTATLDRYLHSIQKPQVYGTGFYGRPGQELTQEPYNRDLIPDVLRRELGLTRQTAQDVEKILQSLPAAAK